MSPASQRFAQFVVPEIPVLMQAARQLTAPSAVDDLVQETLLRAWRGLDHFDGAHPRAWLFTILRNVWKNSLRVSAPLSLDPGSGVLDSRAGSGPGDEDRYLDALMSVALTEGLAALPAAWAAVLSLVDVHRYTYQEAATWLDIPLGTVMSRLHRAHRRLRDDLLVRLVDDTCRSGVGLSKPTATWPANDQGSGRSPLDEGVLNRLLWREPVIVFAFDRDGVITHRQGRGLTLLEQPQGAGVGMSIFDFHRGAPSVVCHAERALAGESTLATVSAGPVRFEVHQRSQQDEAGRLTGVVGVAVAVRRQPRRVVAMPRRDVATTGTLRSSPRRQGARAHAGR